MHISDSTTALFLSAVALALAAQVASFLAIPKDQRTAFRKAALLIGITAGLLSAVAGYRGAIDWGHLPTSPDGLRPGQLWNNNGEPAIIR